MSTFIKNQYLIFFSNKWLFASVLIIFCLLCPIISIFLSAMDFNFAIWEHLISTKLGIYIYNTVILLIGVGIISLILGLSTAWIIAKYNLPFSNILEWALLLPAAIPAYIVAYCYTDFFEYSGFLQQLIRNIFNFNSADEYYFPEIRSIEGAIFVMSFVLYPYIYLISKFAFLSTPISLYEVATLHGKSSFFNVALPISRPAIVAGLSLVLMETISDFGTVEFFAVETLTLGIFNLWLGMNNLAAASQVALVSFSFIFILLGIELTARKKQKFHDTETKNLKSFRVKLTLTKNIFLIIYCFIPIFFGFLLPVMILIEQSSTNFNFSKIINLLDIGTNTLLISGISAFIVVFISTILAITVKFKGTKKLPFLATAAGSGYAFPGIMLALGTTYFFSFLQNLQFLNNLILIGTFSALIFAYVSRFNAVGYGSINSGVLRVSPSLLEASITLGNSFEKSIFKIVLPIIKPSMLVAGILTFVDIAKELPITLVLRPFNFETLSTFVYQYAKDEMFEDSALAALSIIIVGLIPIIILNKFVKPEKFLIK